MRIRLVDVLGSKIEDCLARARCPSLSEFWCSRTSGPDFSEATLGEGDAQTPRRHLDVVVVQNDVRSNQPSAKRRQLSHVVGNESTLNKGRPRLRRAGSVLAFARRAAAACPTGTSAHDCIRHPPGAGLDKRFGDVPMAADRGFGAAQHSLSRRAREPRCICKWPTVRASSRALVSATGVPRGSRSPSRCQRIALTRGGCVACSRRAGATGVTLVRTPCRGAGRSAARAVFRAGRDAAADAGLTMPVRA